VGRHGDTGFGPLFDHPAPREYVDGTFTNGFLMAGKKKPGNTDTPVSASSVGIDLDCLPTLLGFNIRRAQIALWRDFNRNVAEGYVRPGIFSAMLLANANPGIAQIEIANQLGIDKGSVVSLVDRMESAGWVTRQRSTEDRRRQGIFLTPAGVKACRSLKKEMIEHERKFVSRYTDQEIRMLIALLRRLHDPE
jgi:DNA-binding MarR family transcriptional regulator